MAAAGRVGKKWRGNMTEIIEIDPCVENLETVMMKTFQKKLIFFNEHFINTTKTKRQLEQTRGTYRVCQTTAHGHRPPLLLSQAAAAPAITITNPNELQ